MMMPCQSETPEAKKEANLACKREIMTVFGLFFILRIVDIMYVTTAQGINSVITISIGIVCKICTLYRHCYHLFFDRQNDKKNTTTLAGLCNVLSKKRH